MSSNNVRLAQHRLVACANDCSFHFETALQADLLQCLYMQAFNLYILYLLQDILLETGIFSTPMHFL